ncbi:MAG TPA: nitrilase-related carbon-nitrogen hydrolase [Planctomycetota bacterium]|nr:nitrilase-related carbon-nitrogen hydrolase [Planctomycetota bacterium]
MRDVTVAAAQLYGLPGKPAQNLERIAALARQARSRKVDIICFPELAISGFDYDEKLRAVYKASEQVPDGPSTKRLMQIAKDNGLIILAGISELGAGELCYNTCVAVGPEGYIGKYRKVHMNSERWLYCESSSFPVFETPYGTIGISICFDNTFPECARILALHGAEILFAPHCFGKLGSATTAGRAAGTLVRKWRASSPMKFMQSRSYDNNLFSVFSNMVGGPRKFIGGSFVLDPQGNILAQFDRLGEGMAVAHLKAELLVQARAAQTCSLKRRRASIYTDLARDQLA